MCAGPLSASTTKRFSKGWSSCPELLPGCIIHLKCKIYLLTKWLHLKSHKERRSCRSARPRESRGPPRGAKCVKTLALADCFVYILRWMWFSWAGGRRSQKGRPSLSSLWNHPTASLPSFLSSPRLSSLHLTRSRRRQQHMTTRPSRKITHLCSCKTFKWFLLLQFEIGDLLNAADAEGVFPQ